MDKISAVLIIGIIASVTMSAMMIYDTWAACEEATYEVLLFNDDTSVTNNSNTAMWIRARFAKEEGSSEVNIIEEHINEDSWADGGDGWYYHNGRIDFLQATAPLISGGRIENNSVCAGINNEFSVEVEAVDQEWLIKAPQSCREAFVMMRKTTP